MSLFRNSKAYDPFSVQVVGVLRASPAVSSSSLYQVKKTPIQQVLGHVMSGLFFVLLIESVPRIPSSGKTWILRFQAFCKVLRLRFNS